MPINTRDVLQLLSILSRDENLRVTVSESVKNGLIVGGAATAGAILLGPFGLAIGGIVSACATAYASRNKFKSVVEVLSTMEPRRKEELAENVRRIIQNLDASDVVALAAIVAGNPQIKQRIITELTHYLAAEMNMAVQHC